MFIETNPVFFPFSLYLFSNPNCKNVIKADTYIEQ